MRVSVVALSTCPAYLWPKHRRGSLSVQSANQVKTKQLFPDVSRAYNLILDV